MADIKMITRKPILRDDWAVGVYRNANEAWENLYYGLNQEGNLRAPRGLKVKETLGCNIYIINPMDNLVYNTFRGVSPIYLSREYKWYKSGSRSVEDAAKLSKFWETIANDDGTVNSNYGSYIFLKEKDGKSVWEKTVDILRNDPDTRQAIIQIPIMPARGSKDTPCTSHIHFHIRDGQLLATTIMRSTDCILGFPLDIFQFTMWQIEMAHELGLNVGWHRFISDNLHIYEKNWLENVDDEFVMCTPHVVTGDSEYSSYIPSDKSDSLFMDDLSNLAENGKDTSVDSIHDDMLRFMFTKRRIWK